MAAGTDTELLTDIVRAAIHRQGASGWEVTPSDFWCRVQPADPGSRKQGWKLHVSATPLSAPHVLSRAAEVLVAHGAPFKFAGTLSRVSELVSAHADRGSGGKFITVYPRDDEQFRALAAEVHAATTGLPGPGILSDRPFVPGSLVHFRYGAFLGTPVLTNDGTYEVRLEAPDGTLVHDARRAWFSLPPWAESPLPAPSPQSPGGPRSVLLHDRYVVRRAIRHAYKGGVYLGTDQTTGLEVVIKEARVAAGAMLNGTDAQHTLRHEAQVLGALATLGITPRAVETFEQGSNLYLVQEKIDGETLREWVAVRPALDRKTFLRLAGQLVAAVEAVHGAGFVLRDLTPNNVMVTPGGAVRLIDLELAARPGASVWPSHTAGYAGPEIVGAERGYLTASPEGDLYSLGAVLLHLATGVDPVLAADEPASRPMAERLEPLVTGALAGELAALAPLVVALMADEPKARWELARVHAFLDELGDSGPDTPSRLAPGTRDRMLSDGLAHLLATMDPGGSERLWPVEGFGAQNDPLNVQYGAGGVLAVLARGATHDPTLRPGVARVADWIRTRLEVSSSALPGLYFGRSGTAWSLLDAAELLDDPDLADTARQLALRVPVTWPNPDVCHGAAGAGLVQLHFWRATGDQRFADRVARCADDLAAAIEDHGGRVAWTIPADFDSQLAGVTQFGYAHGVAGIGTFLLLAGQALSRPDLLDLARRAGDTLASAALIDGDAAWWPASEKQPGRRPEMLHWCNGSSGVGTFLIRLWQATGEGRYRELAEQGAAAIHRMRWRALPAACHGLAGNAEFLLDLTAATGEDRYRSWAEDLASCMHARHTVRDGRMLVPDESGVAVTAGYNTGLAGVLGLLLRLRHGGTRLWLPDTLALAAESRTGDGA